MLMWVSNRSLIIGMVHIWFCFLFLFCPTLFVLFQIFYPPWYFLFCLHAFTISAEDEKIGKKEKRPEKSLESSPNTSVEDEVKPDAKGQDSGTSLKRAYSLSDLNKPNVPRRILPAPPANGNIQTKSNVSTNQRHTNL